MRFAAACVVVAACSPHAADRARRAARRRPIRITSPADGTYLMGAGPLHAHVRAAERAVDQVAERPLVRGRHARSAPRRSLRIPANGTRASMVNEHLIRAVATLRSGERLVATARTAAVEYAEAVDVDVIQITAVVTDGDGRFVTGLNADDFKVFDEDKPQRLTNFAAENIPLELVAALDVSSSMKDALPAVKRHATDFLAQLQAVRPGDGARRSTTTSSRRRGARPTRPTRAKAIGRLAPWGGTALYDAIVHALDLLGRQSGRRALVVFSDGEDQSSHAPMAVGAQAGRGVGRDDLHDRPGTRAAGVGAAAADEAAGRGQRRAGVLLRTRRRSSRRSSGKSSRISVTSTCSGMPRPTTRADGDCTGSASKFRAHGYNVRARQSYRLAPPQTAVNSAHARTSPRRSRSRCCPWASSQAALPQTQAQEPPPRSRRSDRPSTSCRSTSTSSTRTDGRCPT